MLWQFFNTSNWCLLLILMIIGCNRCILTYLFLTAWKLKLSVFRWHHLYWLSYLLHLCWCMSIFKSFSQMFVGRRGTEKTLLICIHVLQDRASMMLVDWPCYRRGLSDIRLVVVRINHVSSSCRVLQFCGSHLDSCLPANIGIVIRQILLVWCWWIAWNIRESWCVGPSCCDYRWVSLSPVLVGGIRLFGRHSVAGLRWEVWRGQGHCCLLWVYLRLVREMLLWGIERIVIVQHVSCYIVLLWVNYLLLLLILRWHEHRILLLVLLLWIWLLLHGLLSHIRRGLRKKLILGCRTINWWIII